MSAPFASGNDDQLQFSVSDLVQALNQFVVGVPQYMRRSNHHDFDVVLLRVFDQPVEVGGKLPNGPELKSLADLKGFLREEREQFTRCLTEKMLIYALGRGLEYYDDRAVEKIQGDLVKGDYKFSALVTAIARSEPFRLRRGKGQGEN